MMNYHPAVEDAGLDSDPLPATDDGAGDLTPSAWQPPNPVHQEALSILGAAVPGIARALGPDSEVVLHDLSRIPNSIFALGGTLTGRTPGGPVTDLLLRQIRQGRTEDMIWYRSSHSDGRTFRSSTVFLRDDAGVPFACLCINTDITSWLQIRQLLDTHTATSPLSDLPNGLRSETAAETEENFVGNVTDLAATMVRQMVEAVGIPVELMQKPHKLGVVRELERRGLFLIKDAVETTARALGVTKFTIYNYINEIRDGADQEETG